MAPTILVVDDDASIRSLVTALLRRHGLDCEFAQDGQAALEKIDARPYSLILLDLMMPRVDGFEVIRQLRMRGLRTPVVVMTAAGPGRVGTLDPHQVKAVLTKPFDVNQLVDTVLSFSEAADESTEAC